jgi:hypothetical protein
MNNDLITLREAVAVVKTVTGRTVSPAAMERWAKHTDPEKRLKTQKLGGRIYTTRAWLQDFAPGLNWTSKESNNTHWPTPDTPPISRHPRDNP